MGFEMEQINIKLNYDLVNLDSAKKKRKALTDRHDELI